MEKSPSPHFSTWLCRSALECRYGSEKERWWIPAKNYGTS